jgi:NADH-quinone oxidoreductase subunit M
MVELNMSSFPLLTVVTFLPALAALLLLFVQRDQHGLIKGFGIGASLLVFFVSIPLFLTRIGAQFAYVERWNWIDEWGIHYMVGVDGISMLLVMLTTFMTPIVLLGSWNSIHKRVKEFVILMLLLETAMLGAFVSLNLFLFYVFWEAMLIPMYLIIGVWGGERRLYATIKFFIYTMVGSLLMLVAILYMASQHAAQFGFWTFDYEDLFRVGFAVKTQLWLFGAFALAFAIKVPLFPFHTWLPDAHVEAPTAGSVILASILLKMGTYGFIRFAMPFFPDAVQIVAPAMMILAVVGIIYGALLAMVQPDMKKLIAYSSVSHLGFVMLGLFALNEESVSGAVMQMINHGLSTGALFLLIGVIYERRHTRLISEYGGLAKQTPIFAMIFLIVTLSSIGLPGLNGFVGEFLILLGTFKQAARAFELGAVGSVFIVPVLATTGVILAAVYMLWLYQRVMFGKLDNPKNKNLKDMNFREIMVMVPLLISIFWIGLAPNGLLTRMSESVTNVVKISTGKRPGQALFDPSVQDVRIVESRPADALQGDKR